MNADLYELLKTSAEADFAKAKLTLNLLSEKSVGVGGHSAKDYYENAEESLALMKDAKDRLEMLKELKRDM